MQLHIIGGFLGSGKTTAIIGAARYLAAQGKQVGVITNDQGRHLVDSEILRADALPAMEVTGGCFCCHFDDLNQRLKELIDMHHPDVIFAESVGSCADVVATVVRPLLEMEVGAVKPSSYTVFADVRLLYRYLNGLEMPFSDGINYIFGKQIEEAGLLFINKTDLVEAGHLEEVVKSASASYANTDIITASALSAPDIETWVDGLLAGRYPAPLRSLQIDYDRYAEGEGRFAWIDREYKLSTDTKHTPSIIRSILSRWTQIIEEKQWVHGHVKAIIAGSEGSHKISLAQSGEVISRQALDAFPAEEVSNTGQFTILLNMLVEGEPDDLIQQMDAGMKELAGQDNAEYLVVRSYARVPGYPKPTHRIGN
jgi:G3E family GTPase